MAKEILKIEPMSLELTDNIKKHLEMKSFIKDVFENDLPKMLGVPARYFGRTEK